MARVLALVVVMACSRSIVTTVPISGHDAQLMMEIRGRAHDAPILLVLHGGPGAAIGLVAFRAYVGPALESRYLVAYLHQRGVLASPAVPDTSQTIANHVADVEAAVRYLRGRFPGRRVILVGHSWGGILAILSILDQPDLADGVVDVAGPFDFSGSQAASYATTLAWARAGHVADAIAGLEKLGPPPYHYFAQESELSNWSSAANGGITAHISEPRLLARAPYTKFDEAWQARQLRITKAMYTELTALNVEPRLAQLHTPLLVIDGALDAIVPAEQLRTGFAAYGGPKTWVSLEHSNHLAFVDEPEPFVNAVVKFVDR
jgi:pimeloyl-ACP methyl ester carboxylesterase